MTVLYGTKYAFDDEEIQLIVKYLEFVRKEVIYAIIISYVPLMSLFIKQNEESKYTNEKVENLIKSITMQKFNGFVNKSHNSILDGFLSARNENESNLNAEHFEIENIINTLKGLVFGLLRLHLLF